MEKVLTRKELLEMLRRLPGTDPGLPQGEETVEAVLEANAADFDFDRQNCWSRSAGIMPRVRIATSVEEFMFPWYEITQVTSTFDRKVIKVFTSLGQCFVISSARDSLETLYANLQIERVREIHPTDTVKVLLLEPNQGE